MRWDRRHSYVRPPRPKARSLAAEERDQILAKLSAEIDRSVILKAFAVQARTLRGRFYLDWKWNPDDTPEQVSSLGRITPLADPSGQLLLEAEYGRNKWSKIATGTPEKLIKTVGADAKGSFHCLGSLQKSLRQCGKAGLVRLPVNQAEPGKFVYAETGQKCSVQEALYHYFELPIRVIATPAGWYSCHRTPLIVESSPDRIRVLVRFTSMSWSGESFGGTCLYMKRQEKWASYTIRPNQSQDIASAEAWLVKRNWVQWN